MNLLENIDAVDKAAMLFFAAPLPFVLWRGRSVGSSDAAWTAHLTRCLILVMLGALFSAMLLEGSVLPLLLAIPAGLATICPTPRTCSRTHPPHSGGSAISGRAFSLCSRKLR
jgi:hypothetical protein